MSKTEFLQELARHLQVLEESEQQDILAEYAQHIDMKMQGGLSEEEAIRDFGPIRELAADILTAYHVRSDFPPEEEERGHVIYVKAPDMTKLKESGKQAADAVGRQAGRFTAWFRRLCGTIANGFGKLFSKLKRAGGKYGPQGEGEPAPPRRNQARAGVTGFCALCGRGLSRFFRWLGRVIVTLARWAWNACWAVASAFLAFFALASLFAFGLLLVWMVRGYPFVGLTMGALGLFLALGALACLTWTVITTKRRPVVDAAWSEPRDHTSQDAWEEEEDWEDAPPEDRWPEEMLPSPESSEEESGDDGDEHPEGGPHHA